MPDEEYRALISHLKSGQFEDGYRIAKYYADQGSVKAYVERNKTLGKYYFQMASDNGDGYASGELALLAESEEEAFGYQYLGAQQGDTGSMIGLMFSYFHGKGTVRNNLLAAKWINAKTLVTSWTDEKIEDVRAALDGRLSKSEMDTAWAMAWNFVYLKCKCGWNQEEFEIDNPKISSDGYYLLDEFTVTDGSLRIFPKKN
jgi:hypothetical protein